MKTEEKEKEYHASYIVYEQAMLHIHRLTADMKDKSMASLIHYEIMRSLRKSVEIAVEKEKKHIIQAHYAGALHFQHEKETLDQEVPYINDAENYYLETYGHYN